MKKFLKNGFVTLLSATMMFSALPASAAWENTDFVEPEILMETSDVMPYGATMPSTSNVWTLNNGSYTGVIESFEYSVWTNYWYSGATSIQVSLSGSNLKTYLEQTNSNLTRSVTLTLYKRNTFSNTKVGSITVTSADPVRSMTKTFTNLDASAKYTVQVTKSDDDTHIEDLVLKVSGV